MFAKKKNDYACKLVNLCETWVRNPILDQQRDPVVEAGHPLKLQGGGKGGGGKAGENEKHHSG